MKLHFLLILLCLLVGCNSSDSRSFKLKNTAASLDKGYTIEYPAGWQVRKLDKALIPGASGEQAINENGAMILVARFDKAYEYSKHYDRISNEMAWFFAENLFTPLVKEICPEAGLAGPPSITPVNAGRSLQAMYVCGEEIIWFNTIFGKNNAFMFYATGDKHDSEAANATRKCRDSFKILE
jgi:hypothetical protein